MSGTIQSVEVDFNDVVQAGQIVARLDPAPFDAALQQARAARDRARARAAELTAVLDEATMKQTRAAALAARELIAREELDTAQTGAQELQAELKASEAEILAADASVRRAEVDLSHTIIRTPIDGVVVHRHVNVGQTVAARLESPVLLTVADLRRMQLVVEIDEGEVGGVERGTPVVFQVESLGETTFQGHIAEVRLQPFMEAVTGTAGRSTGSTAAPAVAATSGSSAPASSASASTTAGSRASSSPASAGAAGPTPGDGAPGIVTYRAVVDIDNEAGHLLPGGTAVVQMTSSRRPDVVRIPNPALAFAPSGDVLAALRQQHVPSDAQEGAPGPDRARRRARVWRFDNGQLVPLDVTIGLSDRDWTELVDGPIRPGDALVTGAAVR